MAFKTPKDIVQASFGACSMKVDLPISKMLVLGFLAGAYIALGGLLAIIVGRGVNPAAPAAPVFGPGLEKFIFGAVFPVGLMLVVIAGAELFTGNCAIVPSGCLAGKASWSGLLKNWVFVYIGNFIGALFVAYFLGYATGLTAKDPWLAGTKAIAEAKIAPSVWQLFWRGVGCNWLVCLAVWMAIAADDIVSKIAAIWFPIMAFVALGMEHSIANMFFIPLGMFNGANVSLVDFLFKNLLVVTLGNIVGGAVLVAGLYWYVYGRE